MERTLARGNGRSPGGLPHFGRVAAETVDKVYKVRRRKQHVLLILIVYCILYLMLYLSAASHLETGHCGWRVA